ncbi:ATP-binding protein [Tuwongella immobilis]|uniref:histidine kinase n=1 Tax=Tuwongella immobilis TaxID=692036 RepID=A0A6C2YQV0_9BACT|nr:ATP-binding protein [Tuwongella immobilis]VIP03711.1 sensory transduction histidine kinase : Histidine kinase OS=Singulisphaera acidiphila (strain ATCC BAA-1392 / DSM 18658 / VKM B-2454 / MOB10) GN=Sinac_1778 PE=4 SV=1: DUF3365: HAMP: HisKA: HATPase_c [Tuwongella immobilis]VTS04790.1 sensory transduction histidine kinase : Histidine kinase OS=Singulisphaera acidiphila (strain ATCC BAA-1392 / DSM 18658 / VKM B-2454 / MOB10) GN=Sinac_1778 PE=4 SV=1: DUF3365: HAMP: HisKA: HATPase_c [Tuwongella im
MSYRAFKRLLGETSLERKCRFLLGVGTLVLVSASFYLYARQTDWIAYEQTAATGRLLVTPIMSKIHLVGDERKSAIQEFQDQSEKHWPDAQSDYKYRLIKPKAVKPEHQPNGEEIVILKRFLNEREKYEDRRSLESQREFYYYGAIRATKTCLTCHGKTAEEQAMYGNLAEGDLMAMVSIQLSTKSIENGVHINRAMLVTSAMITALLIMAGSYLIIRYIIVKPVKHLKEVSDAISSGKLNVRSEIQTGDEFEDLSHAFNRMLRNLVSMQDRYRRLNSDLDRKVDELARVNMALFESNRLKGDFLATMSHELRTPLNFILGFSDLLMQSGGTLTEKQARWVQNIRSSGQQLLNQINDVLALAKIEAGKMEVHPEELSIPEFCDNIQTMFRQMADKKNIDLRATAAPGIGMVRQDPVKLRQIVSNLLSNAIKFTPEAGRVQVKFEQDQSMLVISVIDSGVGIAPEDQEVVFEKFRQAANPMTREHEGTGLGLSIVRELAKLLGGDVSLKSELGRGSTFTVRISMRLQDAPDAASVFDAQANEHPNRSGFLPVLPRPTDSGRVEAANREPTPLEAIGEALPEPPPPTAPASPPPDAPRGTL